jgi:hypothetical protein
LRRDLHVPGDGPVTAQDQHDVLTRPIDADRTGCGWDRSAAGFGKKGKLMTWSSRSSAFGCGSAADDTSEVVTTITKRMAGNRDMERLRAAWQDRGPIIAARS